jgi:hypothetical protein
LQPEVSEIDPVVIQGARVVVKPQQANAPQKAQADSSSTGGPEIPSFLRHARIGLIDVEVASWEVPGDSGTAKLQHQEQQGEWKWKVDANESAHLIHADLQGKSESHSVDGPWDLALNVLAQKINPQVGEAELRDCRIHFAKKELSLQCPLRVKANLAAIPQVPKIKFNSDVQLILDSKITSNDLLDMSESAHGDLKLTLQPTRPLGDASAIGQAFGAVQVHGDWTPVKKSHRFSFKTDGEMNLKIDRFEKLVQFLDPTHYAVPAPFDALKGEVELSAKANFDENQGDAPITLKTRLSSDHDEKFDLDGSGLLSVQRMSPFKSHLDFDLVLSDVQIPLPHFDLAIPPALLPDSRITTKAIQKTGDRVGQKAGMRSREPAPSALDYHFTIKTGKTMRIQTNLAKALIPVDLNLTADKGKDPLGTIRVGKVPLDLLHRKAEVQFIQVELVPPSEKPSELAKAKLNQVRTASGKPLSEKSGEKKLSGDLRIDYTDYVIHIELYGTVDEPGYKFESDPPLSDTDIISVLIFGRTAEDLDEVQGQSVGNVQAAAAGRGLDLASLYFLASTPVESVGYDPQTGAVSANFRIADGTSLNVTRSQSEDMQSIGIRKRIGGNWSIVTQQGNPADPSDKSVSALLQWSHRY